MLTPFGIALRKLRLDKGLRLLDLAQALGHSSSFVSAVEIGRKPIPPGYIAAIAKALDLTPDEARPLQHAADRTRPTLSVDGLPGPQRELVAAFARNIDALPPEVLDEIRKHVFKAGSGEAPFRRRRPGLLVAPVSTAMLWRVADRVRRAFVDDAEVCFPIMDVLEFRLPRVLPDFHVAIGSRAEMGADEGRVVAGQLAIELREDVYEGAWRGSGRDRFTAAHELGHLLLHRHVTLARRRDDAHPIYSDAEWQADTFAGGLLLSARHLDRLTGPRDAAVRCGMTPSAASVMWAKYARDGRAMPDRSEGPRRTAPSAWLAGADAAPP